MTTTTLISRAEAQTAGAIPICEYDALVPDLGVAALVGGIQVAVFRLADGAVHAVQNLCPFADAHVISRGITGTRGSEPTIASPIYKQVFSLLSGRCLVTMDKAPAAGHGSDLAVFPVTVTDGVVLVGETSRP